MLFERSCRPFLALIYCFLLVVQVVAVPTKGKRRKDFRTAVGYKSIYNFPISVHEEAKLVNSKAYHANIAAGRLHEAYAQSLSGPDQLAHHNAAEHHYAAATGHLRKAHEHSAEVDKHRANAGGRRKPNIRKLKKATEKAEKSLEKARNLHQQAVLGHSLMVAAQEHRVTEAAHGQAALQAEGRGHQSIKNYHLGRQQEHSNHASTHANHAVEYLRGLRTYPTQPNIHNHITAAWSSADHARSSKKVADVTIQGLPPR